VTSARDDPFGAHRGVSFRPMKKLVLIAVLGGLLALAAKKVRSV
jgi:hypothetical protein